MSAGDGMTTPRTVAGLRADIVRRLALSGVQDGVLLAPDPPKQQ